MYVRTIAIRTFRSYHRPAYQLSAAAHVHATPIASTSNETT